MSSSPSGANQSLYATDQTRGAKERYDRETADTTLQENIDVVSSDLAALAAKESSDVAGLSAAIDSETSRAKAAEALLAPLDSPALTGTPTAPTAASGTNTTQLATTAFVGTAVSAEASARATADTTNATAISTEASTARVAEHSIWRLFV